MKDDPLKSEAFVQQLRATFLDELHVHVGSLGRELLALEGNDSEEQRAASWMSVFRSAHTLKGAAAVVDIEPIHRACHRMEDLFESYRTNNAPLSAEMTSKLLKVVDAMEEMGMRLRAEQELDGAPLSDLLPELEQIADAAAGGKPIDDACLPPESVLEEQEAVAESDQESNDRGEYEFEVDDPAEMDAPGESTPQAPTSLDINAALLPIFLEELEDRCSRITEDAIAMETADEDEQKSGLLDDLFRSAHSLKGAAGVVKLTPVQSVCHALEEELDAIRAGQATFSTHTASRLLEAVDAIRELGDQLRKGESLADALISELDRIVDAARSAGAPSATDTQSDPSPANRAAALATPPPTQAEPKPPPQIGAPSLPGSKPVVAKTKSSPVTASSLAEHATIRVPAQKLDALLSHSGELLVARNRLAFRASDAATARELALELRSLWRKTEQSMRNMLPADDRDLTSPANVVVEQTGTHLSALTSRLESLASDMETDNRFLNQTCDRLESEVMHVRMLPFSDACGGLQRAVRDIATSVHKQISLKLEGGDVEVDRSVLEGLKDPLLHLVRNAADHGIESPQQRESAGKSASASIIVSAALRGGQVEVTVRDDGGGLDLRRICDIARKRDIEIPEDPREQARLIFAPGFSTAKMITDISGRGVGLDVVQCQVESLHGSVDVSFVPGEGTCFTLTVPLTLTTIRSMLVVASGQTFAIPTTAVDRLVRFNIDDLRSTAGRDALLLGDAPVQVVPLGATLGLPTKGLLAGRSAKGMAIVMCVGDQRVAMVVDDVEAEQEVLVKSLGSRVRRLKHFSGCTVLADGQVALVVNSANVIRSALGQRSFRADAAKEGTVSTKQAQRGTRSLLLAEDAVTTRVLLKNILEAAGYIVTTAVDGQAAWDLMQENAFDILVTDIDMPRMDGFDLTSNVRHSEQHRDLPVILVTARGTDADKQRGVQVGANAYIVKDSFEQHLLLDTIAQLV